MSAVNEFTDVELLVILFYLYEILQLADYFTMGTFALPGKYKIR